LVDFVSIYSSPSATTRNRSRRHLLVVTTRMNRSLWSNLYRLYTEVLRGRGRPAVCVHTSRTRAIFDARQSTSWRNPVPRRQLTAASSLAGRLCLLISACCYSVSTWVRSSRPGNATDQSAGAFPIHRI